MALADIIKRIEDDGDAEAKRVLDAARERSDAIRAQAEAAAAQERTERMAAAESDAAREASRIVVAARLAARDRSLSKRRELVDEALAASARKLAELPDDRYAAFLAEKIAAAAAGGEQLLFGSDDKSRSKAVMVALAKVSPGLSLGESSEAAPFSRGALLIGDRVQADLSLAAIVEERRDELELVLSSVLFGGGE